MVYNRIIQSSALFTSLFEGFSSTPYQDQGGVWTIGYGTTMIGGQPVTAETPAVTKEQALELLANDLQSIYDQLFEAIDGACVYANEVDEEEWNALLSLAYNVGARKLLNSDVWKLFLNGLKKAESQRVSWAECWGRLEDQNGPSIDTMVYQWGSAKAGFVNVDGQFNQGLYNRRSKELARFFGDSIWEALAYQPPPVLGNK